MADRFDLDAIEADDALLDLLAAGGESARAAGEHDAAVALLADLRLAVEVEGELPVESIDDPESFLARCAALNPITDPFARKMATRGLAFGVAAVAALSVSGVAAAVTGDPLSPYEKVIEKMVDAVRPQTSFPKEDLDGLPVVDRSKIVKVGKDFKEKAKAERAAENGKAGASSDDPQAQAIKGTPEVVVPPGDRPIAFPLSTDEQKTQDPVKPTTEVTPTPTDTTTTEPTDTKTTEPTDTKTTEPTDTKTTDTPPDTPVSTPTEEPTDTTNTPTPTPTDTTTTPPTNGDTNTGDNTGNTATGDPTSTPSSGSGSGEGQTSDGDTTPGSDSTTTPDGTSSSDTSGSDTSGDTPGGEVTQTPAEVKELADIVGDIIAPVLPTPSGEPVANVTAERFFGTPDETAQSVTTSKATAKKAAAKAAAKTAAGKHASGKVSTGSVRKAYPKGKHSSGAYAEGKHAAIARTYGSTTDASLLQILDVVNKPIR